MINLLHDIQPPENDVIKAPAHYVEGRNIEPISVIEDWNLNHNLACALKYISKAGRKNNEVKDLKKAIWYLERRIKLLVTANSEMVD